MQQIKNVYYYTCIMLMDNMIITTSPDYLTEKSLKFFGKLGKNEFIEYPKIKYQSQLSSIVKPSTDFWKIYCRIWNIKSDDFKVMNMINFLLNVTPIFIEKRESQTFNEFEKFIGNIESTSKEDLSYMVNAKLLEYFDEHVDFNTRFFKLKTLESIY